MENGLKSGEINPKLDQRWDTSDEVQDDDEKRIEAISQKI